ncbi:MAG: polyphosphate:AMP phosphotransferase [Spirochaetes bacterium GWF1_41_5]|nr:MAG: polyphosphate:AMP phosphotransferase [Spirochaetes bacterium GWF1_41_5]
MLEQIDINKKISKEKYKEEITGLTAELGVQQRNLREKKIPVIMVFEGWAAAGKGTMINNLLQYLDPRGASVYSIHEPNEEERLRPFLWRFWVRTPEAGRIAVFDRSWCCHVIDNIRKKPLPDDETAKAYADINAFERQLADNGAVLLKFFLHIGKKEQKKRFRCLENDKTMSWRVSKKDKKQNKQYRIYLAEYEQMIRETDSASAPWYIIESMQERFAEIKILQTIVQTLSARLCCPAHSATAVGSYAAASILDAVNLARSMKQDEYSKRLEHGQRRLRELEHLVYQKRLPVIIAYEGSDAAGKGGNIRRVTANLDPRGYEVIPIAAPNDIEKAHHYLWRFWKHIPKAGHIAIFDRTWYGRVLVERAEGFASDNEWQRAYREINEMEQHLCAFGAVLIKFWLQIDQEEQLLRFREREQNESKKWKITNEDWRNREKWNIYRQAVDEMLCRTSTASAPWVVVESNCKLYARIKTIETIIKRIEDKL